MTISLSRYVDITSGVGGAAVVPTRDLVARFMTANAFLPPQTFISFTDAAEVGQYFGLQSEEYLRALFYFSFISKNLTQPQSIQFARWVQNAANPQIFPIPNASPSLTAWNAVTSGSFILTMGGFSFTLSGLNFSSAGSLAAVAGIIQSAIQAESGGGAMWTSATVTYQTTLNGVAFNGFVLTGGAAGTYGTPINVEVGGGGTDITGTGFLGWLPEQTMVNGNLIAGAIWSEGSAAETVTQTLNNTANASNNFGSFAFLTNLNVTEQNVNDAATWNQTQNALYMYSQAVTPANASTWASTTPPGVGAIGGVGLTLSPPITQVLNGTVTNASNVISGLSSNATLAVGMPVSGTDVPAGAVITALSGSTSAIMSVLATGTNTGNLTFSTLQFPEMAPMMILAATNYYANNSVQNYEFQQFAGLTPSVADNADADTYDALNINYYGVTANAGTQIAFYQTGVLQGESISTNIIDMNAYANEIWLKDAASAAIMNLLLSVAQVPANVAGQNMILNTLQGVINQAVNNGTISVGKTLTTNQQMFITSASGDPLAWYQVQNNGYWVNVVIQQSGSIFQAVYTLIYSKDDVIRKVVGTHTLI